MMMDDEADSSSCCSLDQIPEIDTSPVTQKSYSVLGTATQEKGYHDNKHRDNVQHRRIKSASQRTSTPQYLQELADRLQYRVDPLLQEEIERFVEQKKRLTMHDAADESAWRDAIRQQLETDLDKRVRQALQTPPPVETMLPASNVSQRRTATADLNARLAPELVDKERDFLNKKKLKAIQAKRRFHRLMTTQGHARFNENDAEPFSHISQRLSHQISGDDYSSVFGMNSALRDTRGQQSYFAMLAQKANTNLGSLKPSEKHEFYYAFTKNGFKDAMSKGHLPDGSMFERTGCGKYRDKYGIIRDEHGPFWPPDYGPLFPKPHHRQCVPHHEPLTDSLADVNKRSVDNQNTPYTARWRGVQIVFDSERSPKDVQPPSVSEGHCPSLLFESRFESGNLRQARRVGQFEYELVLKTDLYTQRHTQWFYFRVKNALPNITYKFTIINLLKRDSLYNHGMRPLVYSEHSAKTKNMGWVRAGHHVAYTRNTASLQCPVLQRDRAYFSLEWQIEFANADDTYYLAHCYPYTFTDLRDDLDALLADPERSQYLKREVMCETRAGNSCFLLTVTNFECQGKKKAVVVSARVHPGETNSSWMMRGLLTFITGSMPSAKELRNRFVFKIVPMLNPDGVIVGNYRCSLAGRDLNRNYRHPRKESFPTVWHTKDMMEQLTKQGMEILVYCDLHGHSRKQNVFMYGCNTPGNGGVITNASGTLGLTEAYLKERLYPWLMAQKAPDKFCFRGCKFQIRKCKESTGRVVMYRQLQVVNSFTMEATFCGTNICKGDGRHFNTHDFEHMGRVFAEVLLDYNQAMENRSKLSDAVLDLTRAIAQQFLENTGVLPSNLPDFSTEAGRERLKEYSLDGEVSTPEKLTAAFLSMVKCSDISLDGAKITSGKQITDFTLTEIHSLVERMSRQTMDGCIKLLEDLHVADRDESDSSDSDSESEPEMPMSTGSEPRRQRRKKKKHKKNKSRAGESRSESDKARGEVVESSKSESSLPAIHSADSDAQHMKNKKTRIDATWVANKTKVILTRSNSGGPGKHTGTNKMEDALQPFTKSNGINKLGKGLGKNYPGFVNKYSGRSNGGIPCFSEERMSERAAKRVEEMKRRYEDQQKAQAIFQPMSSDNEYWQFISGYQGPNSSQPQVARSNTVANLTYRSSMRPNSDAKSPPPIHTSYMHADMETHSPEYTSKTHPLRRVQVHSVDSSSDESDEGGQPTDDMRQGHPSLPAFTPAFLQPLPKRINRLPTMYHQQPITTSVPDSSSIPLLRHTQTESLSSPLAITAISDSSSTGNSKTVNTSYGQVHRPKASTTSTASLEKTAPLPKSMSMSPQPVQRQYTDLLLHHINNYQRPHHATTAHKLSGPRHSTCE